MTNGRAAESTALTRNAWGRVAPLVSDDAAGYETMHRKGCSSGVPSKAWVSAIEIVRSLTRHPIADAQLPVCIANTPISLSADPTLRGRPDDFEASAREMRIDTGAGFPAVLSGHVLCMPDLPRRPLAERIEIEAANGRIGGLE